MVWLGRPRFAVYIFGLQLVDELGGEVSLRVEHWPGKRLRGNHYFRRRGGWRLVCWLEVALEGQERGSSGRSAGSRPVVVAGGRGVAGTGVRMEEETSR